MRKFFALFAIVGATAFVCFAGSTRTWTQSDYADFEKGNIKSLSMRSDGRLSVAPKLTERFDSSSSYLWAMAQDSSGTIYAGGGPGAKLFRIAKSGGKTVAEFDALEIHAIAINAKDEVFVGTSPDGKVYKVDAAGKSSVFYDPKQKYIWGMTFGPQGDLFVATGDHGEIHRVTPKGAGGVFFKADETHARSLVFDAQGNLIVGTEPGGLVMRINSRGEGFVLYQMAKREVTAVAVAPDGSIYAASAGSQSAAPVSLPPPAPAAPPAGPVMLTPTPAKPAADAPASATPGPRASAFSGGADVFRIHPGGYPEKIWTSAKDAVYAIAFDADGKPLLGTGNRGTLYRIDSPSMYTALLSAPTNQITALFTGRDGAILAATSNIGKIFSIGPGFEPEGSIESDVFDAGGFAQWGRLSFDGQPNGGRIEARARSGNLDRPQKNWSAWSQPVTQMAGDRLSVPPARFLQWKATLKPSAGGATPDLDSVDAAYLARNVAPRVEQIEATPANFRFPASIGLLPAAASLTLPPIGKHAANSSGDRLELGTPTMSAAKGWIGARWLAVDENGDTLSYTLQIRGVNEKEWKPLKEKLREHYFSFDSTVFPDGEYRLRVIASDSPSNTPPETLTGELVSATVLIDNTPPVISAFAASGDTVKWKAADALNLIRKAEYSVDGGDWTIVNPITGLSDSLALDYELKLPGIVKGEHAIAVRVTDEYDNAAVAKTLLK